jgi:hypothetical protein
MKSKWYTNIDSDGRKATVEYYDSDLDEEFEVEVPIRFEVCPTCEGRGRHVNPSIDSHGISVEEFYEDPDFAEDYMSGVYDVPCYECGGKNVVPEIDEQRCDPELFKKIEKHQRDLEDDARTRYDEMRWGC